MSPTWEENPDARSGVSFAVPSPGRMVRALLIANIALFVLQWVVLDGTFRPSSVVGGIASLGMFAVEPVVRRVLGWAETRQVLAVFGLHVVLVGACSRVAGLRSSTFEALVITAVVLVAAGVALAVIERRADAGPDGEAAPGGELAPVGDDARGTSAFPHIS